MRNILKITAILLLFGIPFFYFINQPDVVINKITQSIIPVKPIVINDVYSGINQKRAENNVSPLIVDKRLEVSACEKANDMVTNNYWEHTSPSGVSPWYFIKKQLPDYKKAGENLYRGQGGSDEAVTSWYNSQGHKNNMIDSKFTAMGICSVFSDNFNGNLRVFIVVNHFVSL